MDVTVQSTDFRSGFKLPSLLTQLQSILHQYPDDGQILKELIQNAEDAGAKRVVFLLDHTTYPDAIDKLHHPEMKLYQGPALYCYNDAVFEKSDDRNDWDGIRMISDSIKRNNPMKVGRFGLGFKSVFHMTDLPSIFSGEDIGFLDPHEQFFQIETGRFPRQTSSYLWNLESDKEYIRQKIDQFSPFFQNIYKLANDPCTSKAPHDAESVKFGFPVGDIDMIETLKNAILKAGYFDGTLFRFPLRVKEMQSELSSTLYTPQKVLHLFDSLKADAHMLLLFLKSIETIEVYEKIGAGVTPTKLMEIGIQQGSRDVVAEARKNTIAQIEERRQEKRTEPVSIAFEMSTQFVMWSCIEPQQDCNTYASSDRTTTTETKEWVISHYFAGEGDLADGGEGGNELGYLPWVAVAQPLQALGGSQPLPYMDQPKGQIFCFLPLPLDNESPTGFHFHVHGYFAMDQNRRHIKKRTAEQIGTDITDQSLLWNEYLIQRLMPNAVRDTLTYIANSTSLAATYGHDLIYSTIPNLKLVKEQWKPVGEQIMNMLPDMHVFHSEVAGGKLVKAFEARFDYIDDRRPLQGIIRRVMCASSLNLVSVPSFILEQLDKRAQLVSAVDVCLALKLAEGKMILSDDDRMMLLRHLIDSLDHSDFKRLVNTKLLPLSDNTWTEFKPCSREERVYVDCQQSPRSLLPGFDHHFIRPAAQDIGKRLMDSGVTQLVVLDQKEVASLVRQLLQPYNERQEISVTELKWFSKEWLKQLWQYLTEYHDHMELSKFDGLHILPGSNEKLLKLSRRSAVVVRQCESGLPLTEPIADICSKLGLTVIEHLPKYVANHPDIWGEYVQRPDGIGIITALNQLKVDDCVVSCFDNLGEDQKDHFRNFVIRAALTDQQIFSVGETLLRNLPMFRVVPNSTNSGRSHVSICDVNTAAPDSQLPVPFRRQLLDASDSLVRDFLLNFGIKPLSVSDALVDYVFPDITDGHYGVEDIVGLMEFVFNHWSELEQNPQVANHLSVMKFVPTRSGQLCLPRELFDCSDIWIKQLFGDEDVYPCGVLAESKYRHILKQLRLKGAADITADDILDIARKLEVTHSPERTSAMMKFLESNTRLLSLNVAGESLLNKLKSMRWVALKQERPDRYPKSLEFGSSEADSRFNRPQDIISSKYVSLVGSVRPIVDTSSISQLSALFNWIDEPPIQQVVSHLLNVISAYDQQQNVDSDNDSCSATRKSCDDQAEFHSTLKHIYSYLDRHISEFEAVAEQLTAVGKWVWYFNGFAEPSEMVLQKSFRDLEPFVFVIPANFVTFRRLWQRVGIEDNCNLVKVMNRISEHHSDPERVFTSEKVKRDLDISVCILNEIARSPERGIVRDQLQVPVKTNHETLVLKPIDDCTYCDEEWYQKGFDVQHIANNPDINLIHPSISIETAEALGIHSICSRLLDAEELDYESFGQSEPLTRRLRNILHDYNDGLAVIKELIQNADDAGATKVKFLYDQRTNEEFCTKLIDPGMKQVQGPALWAYNDALFSSEDFDNLVKLSGATKKLCKNKVGRFGLGFNAVYNLTDVPSLVSNGHVVFLDPHTTHLNRAIRDKSKPGIKIDIVNKRKQSSFIDIYTDQFEPYNNIFGCDVKEITTSNSHTTSYPGTLFRFPLRNEQQGRKSEISNKHYDHNEVCSLFHLLAKIADQILLFTQSVTEISFYHLDCNESNPQNMELQFTIGKHLQRVLRDLPGTKPFAFLREADKLIAGYQRGNGIPQMESSAVVLIDYKKGQNSKAELSNNVTDSSSHWLVTSCIGSDKSFQKAVEESDLISVGGAAAPLHSDDNGRYSPSDKLASNQAGGRVFCFMPLPIASSLPVHINGYFAVMSSRMHLVEETVDDKSTPDAAWNVMLMEDAVKQAYVILLQDLVKLCPSSEPYSLWPRNHAGSVVNSSSLFDRLINAVYDELCCENGPKVFKGDQCIVNINQCKVLDMKFRESTIGPVALSVFKQVKSYDMEVIDLPIDVMNAMLKTPACAEFSRYLVNKITFFRDYFLANISKATADERDQLVLEGLFDDSIKELLSEYNCIPVKPYSVLKSPRCLIHPLSELAILFDETDERFPLFTSKVRTPSDYYHKLVSLGMKFDDLPWTEIAARCNKVRDCLDIAPRRTEMLVRLMSKKIVGGVSPSDRLLVDQIKKTKFLPTAMKPTDFSLPWRGDECGSHVSCEEAYLSCEKYAVCCSFPLIDDNAAFGSRNGDLKELLSVNGKRVEVDTILHQLDCVLDKTDSTGKIIVESRRELAHIVKIVNKVHSYLNSYAENIDAVGSSAIFDALRGKKCIFVASANSFLFPRCCAMSMPAVESQTLLPYLCAVPDIMEKSYPWLLAALKVQSSFSVDDYVAVLDDMHSRYQNNPLSPHDLKVAACIINCCLTWPQGSISPQVYIPNADGVLCPALSLCYSIDEFLSLDDTELCNSSILPKAARSLGVRTAKHAYIDQNAIGIPFGQKEELVVRLQRILVGYPFDKEILKEMLQNADDAGATEIHFILDKRQLATDHVFDDSWKPLQGPALCIYNNKPFTSKDIEGIQKLGEGSKGHDPTKTGQYGVGFNCVYHVTDVPLLLTHVDGEETLCIFDPNCKFFPGTTRESPGRRLNVQSKLKTAFRDVFAGFLMNDYVDHSSTFFRLPLRNTDSAAISEISKKPVTVDSIEELFKTFISDLHDSMLFLNSIAQIHLRVIEANSDDIKTFYSTSSKLRCEDSNVREELQRQVSKVAKDLKNGTKFIQDIDTAEVAYEVEITDSCQRSTQWIVVQKFGFDTPDVVPESVKNAYAVGDIGLLPRGGLAYCTNSNKTIERNGRLFCFLPLPVPLALPVHVNGHFSLSSESRRELWHSESANEYRTDWNTCVMNNVIAPAYCTLLQRVKESLATRQLSDYYALFPTVFQELKTNSYVNNMSISVYQQIASKQLPLLTVYSSDDSIRWLPPLKTGNLEGYFDDLIEQVKEPEPLHSSPRNSLTTQETTTMKHETVREVLTATGFILFQSPIKLYNNFILAGVHVKKVAPENVLDFFSSFQSSESVCKLKMIDVPIAQTVFKDIAALNELLSYCTASRSYKQQLVGLPFLVTCDNYVRQFTADVIRYDPQFAAVLPHTPDKFIHRDVFRSLKLNSNEDTHLSIRLSAEDFVRNLADLLPVHIFRGASECVPLTTLAEHLNAAEVPISWLAEMWNFLSFVAGPTREQTKSVIKIVQDWCLLPAVFGGNEVLFSIAKSRCVISLDKNSITRQCLQIQKCLQKLGIPQPLFQYFNANEGPKLYFVLMGGLDDASSVVNALSKVIESSVPPTGRLHESESLALLTYLTEKLSTWRGVPDGIETIQKLPIFCTVAGKLVSIYGCCTYVIPFRVPTEEMDCWKSSSGVVFLRNGDKLILPLLKYIGCVLLTETELYCSFILQHIQLLSDKGRYVHLIFIRDRLLPELQQDSQNAEDREKRIEAVNALASLRESLNKLDFIPSRDGSLHRASNLYDPSHDVFKVMEDESLFPAAPFNASEWLEFLRQCGMVHKVTQKLFYRYAMTLAHEGKVKVTDQVERKSKTLVKHFFQRNDVTNSDFLERVREIPFIVPHCVGPLKEKLHEQYGMRNAEGNVQLLKFANSIITTCADCVWAVQTVLPTWACPDQHCRKYVDTSLYNCLFSRLGVDKQPQLETVAKHVQALCSKLSTVKLTQHDSTTLKNVLETVYSYLQSKMPLPVITSALLSLSPLVYDKEHNLLVRPDQVVVRYHERLIPYLIPLPFNVGNYKTLICALGAVDGYEPTLNQYANVLRMLHARSKDQVLRPAEREIVHSVMREFFTRIMNSNGSIDLTEEELYLPGRDMKLHKSTDTVFDDKSILHRLRNFDRPVLMDLTKFGLGCTYDIQRSLTRLPAAVQPQLMSAVVVEELCPDFQDVEDLQLAVVMDKHIRSPQFQQGLVRLAWHCASKGGTTVSRRDSEAVMLKAVEGLQNVFIRGVDKLETVLLYKGVPIEGSKRGSEFFIDVRDDGSVKWTVYVTSWCYYNRTYLMSELAEVVIAACDHLFKYDAVSHICKILDCEPEVIDEILDRCRVLPLTDDRTGESLLPVLGSFVPKRDYCCLRQDIQLLQPGEFAAMDVGNVAELERTYILVKIVEKLENGTDGMVADSFTTEVGAVYRVLVKTLAEQNVRSTLLYAFAREAIDPSTVDKDDHLVPSNYDDATRGLKAALQDAWKLPEADRKRVLMRLMQPWLPDNDHVDRELAKKVLEFVFMASDRLEKNLPIDDSDVVAINAPSYRPVWIQQNTSYGALDNFAGSCFKYLTARAEQHRREREQYEHRVSRNRSAGERDRKIRSLQQFYARFITTCNPQPGEGRRWLRQADLDFQAAGNDIGDHGCKAFEWSCFKYYQAAWKALRGVQYARDANRYFNAAMALSDLTSQLDDFKLKGDVKSLVSVVNSPDKMMYPGSRVISSNIPNDVYLRENAETAKQLCSDILEWSRDYIKRADQ